MVANSGGKDRDVMRRIMMDKYMDYAIRECYMSFRNITNILVFGQCEKAYVLILSRSLYDCRIWY